MNIWVVRMMFWISFLSLNAGAAVYYVDANNTAPIPPFTSWTTAATNIQDAINLTANGDTVLVTNGIYSFGGVAMVGTLTNRVALTNAISVQSVNGPWVTTIQGAGATNSLNAVRCAWLTNGASLNGFTLTSGATQPGNQVASAYGGGVWCASSNAWVTDCVIVSNTAYWNGGGVYQGTISDTLISSNGVVVFGGGATYGSVLNNCSIISNAMYGVVNPVAVTNCIVYYNGSGNVFAYPASVSHCCTAPAMPGTGNFTNPPQLFADGVHLAANSPCIGNGVFVGGGSDIFGMTWSNPPSVGCAEWQSSPLVSVPDVQLSRNPVGFSVVASIGGSSPYGFAWLENGLPLQDDGHFTGTQSTNLAVNGVCASDAGGYQLIVSNSFGVVTSRVAQVVIHCVDAAGANPVAPYLGFSNAATNIQDAITAAVPGEIVLVTNGLYATGGKSMDGVLTNRVTVDKAILLQSVNGASATVIQGAWDPIATNGPGAVRCAWLTNNAILSGFTLQGGGTAAGNAGGTTTEGAGVWGSSLTNRLPGATVSHCFIIDNVAGYYGGGAYQVVLNNCTIATNSGITAGGGAELCYIDNCLITYNSAGRTSGGGTDNSHLFNCALFGNIANSSGNAASGGTLVNCTVVGNGSSPIGLSAGAVSMALLTNCIVYGNFGAVFNYPNSLDCTLSYSDTDPLPGGIGNVDINPQLLPDNIHVSPTSPCIGAGISNVISGTDIDGHPWNNPPSMGCSEWQPAPIIAPLPIIHAVPSAHILNVSAVVAGQTPFACFWTKDGTPIQDDGHYSNSETHNLVVNNFTLQDAGAYQVVVTNSFGVATSAVFHVVIHAVAAAGQNPVPPYSTWETAATNIQDAIDIAAAGDIVLVTNGIYASGGVVVDGNVTNRIALILPVNVCSVNGYSATIIRGAWDPIATNGPDSVRCAYLVDGAVLDGFTLCHGSTLGAGDYEGPLTSGGGVYCTSTNGVVSNCVLTNNSAITGGGSANGTLNNSLVVGNFAFHYGGGAYVGTLMNCTVVNNQAFGAPDVGGGTYGSVVKNCIVIGNLDRNGTFPPDNCWPNNSGMYFYSCVTPLMPGTGNTSSSPYFLDLYHLSSLSPGVGDGSAAYASGVDLDGQPWNNPPSMGCSEVVSSNLVGPLSVSFSTYGTNLVLNNPYSFFGSIIGRASSVAWSFGDGLVFTNIGASQVYQWTNAGNYTISFTAYNNDNPDGVATNVAVQVGPLATPQLQSPVLLTNGFQFQFPGQIDATYTIQYTTNLTPPIVWQTLQAIGFNTQDWIQIVDGPPTNSTRFYRVVPSDYF